MQTEQVQSITNPVVCTVIYWLIATTFAMCWSNLFNRRTHATLSRMHHALYVHKLIEFCPSEKGPSLEKWPLKNNNRVDQHKHENKNCSVRGMISLHSHLNSHTHIKHTVHATLIYSQRFFCCCWFFDMSECTMCNSHQQSPQQSIHNILIFIFGMQCIKECLLSQYFQCLIAFDLCIISVYNNIGVLLVAYFDMSVGFALHGITRAMQHL